MDSVVVAIQVGSCVFLAYGGVLCLWQLVNRPAPVQEPRLRVIAQRDEPPMAAAVAVPVEERKAA